MQTVYVIGAGASAEVGMPTGKELKTEIAKLLKVNEKPPTYYPYVEDGAFNEAIRKLSKLGNIDQNNEKYYNAAKLISNNIINEESIDNFINIHKGDHWVETIGKLAIVRIILEKERASKLSKENSIVSGEISNTWYTSFFNNLTEFRQYDNIKERLSKITLIIFNYDRCVEYYLLNRFEKCYNISVNEAAKLVESINIIHPYGYLGEIHNYLDNDRVGFGEVLIRPDKLLKLKDKIKTFAEGTDPSSNLMFNIRDCIVDSKRVVFLGFAFHQINMKILNVKNNLTGINSVLGTVFKEPENNYGHYINDIVDTLNMNPIEKDKKIKLYGKECWQLFTDNSRDLKFN